MSRSDKFVAVVVGLIIPSLLAYWLATTFGYAWGGMWVPLVLLGAYVSGAIIKDNP